MDWIFYYWLKWWHHFPKHDHLSRTKQEHTSLRKNKYVICFLIRYKAISLNVSDFSRKFDAISNLWTAQASQNGAEHHSSWLSGSLSIPREIVSKSNQLFTFGSPCRTEPMEFSNIGANNSSKLGMSMILDHFWYFKRICHWKYRVTSKQISQSENLLTVPYHILNSMPWEAMTRAIIQSWSFTAHLIKYLNQCFF